MLVQPNPFWQWDINRYLILYEPEGTVISKIDLVMESDPTEVLTVVPNRSTQPPIVPVPNVLLQSSRNMRIYARLCNEDDSWTLYELTLYIRPREKPPDYVYEETQVETWRALVERVAALEEAGGTSDHTKLGNRDVEEQHPIQAITGLRNELNIKINDSDKLSNLEIDELLGW